LADVSLQASGEVSTSSLKRKVEETPVANEAASLVNEYGKRMRFDAELIDSSPEDAGEYL
jgi:hypothetical protein